MVWTEKHNVLLCREFLSVNPFLHKKSSLRGQAWHEISGNLSSIREPYFKVDRRAVRDRYNLLSCKLRKKLKQEEKASGIETDMTETEDALEDLIEKDDAADQQQKENVTLGKRKVMADRENVEDMRAKALEKLGETQKRKESKGSGKKKRSNGTETLQFLREKNEMVAQQRKEDLAFEMQKQEVENKKHKEFIQLMHDQQKQQQDQVQHMQSIMVQQQQQQNQLMMALISKLVLK